MNASVACPQCGKPVGANGLQGLCAECLMAVGLATRTADMKGDGRHLLNPPPALADVAKHFPQFEMLECLGAGGMGAVYKARQPRLDRFVALKILTRDRAELARDVCFAERFEREARALARLNHPNIVAVYEFGEAEGLPYLIMEYVDGLNLRQLERANHLSPREALQIVPQICEALQFAHDAGVVHRDIKPENILLDKKGRVKIADFGIAKMMGKGVGQPALTRDEQVIGTPHYMSPEQVEHPQQVDHRADIYSLGVVFYEMLTGELPIGKFQPPSCKVPLDIRLDDIVLHTLEKEPERRYQHASEVRTDVENVTSTPSPFQESAALENNQKNSRMNEKSMPSTTFKFTPKKVVLWAVPITIVIAAALLLSWRSLSPSQVPTAGTVASVIAGPVTNEANGHLYYLLTPGDWDESEAEAAKLRGHLVTISDAAEQAWVYETFGNFDGTPRALWIGLTRLSGPGQWSWVAGDRLSYANWAPREPNGADLNEDCVHLWPPNHQLAGLWNDAPRDRRMTDDWTPFHGVVEVVPKSSRR